MAVQMKVPSSPAKSIQTFSEFLGVDFTNSEANVDLSRSPNAPNMIRDVPGKVRKCMGWEVITEYEDAPVNGYHALRGDTEYLVHVGTKLYHGEDVVYSNMNNAKSQSWQFGDKLYIIDGKEMLVYYQTEEDDVVTHHVESASADAYIPTVTISKNPDGGGTPYEDLNLLQPGFTESFLGTAGTVKYALSFGDLDDTSVEAKVMNSSGEWVDKVEGTDFTVDRTTGVITFNVAPGESPVTGEDNVVITAYRTVDDYSNRINKCTFGVLYGVNGGNDRLFLSGNPEYPNYDWHSAQYDPTYFADTSYARLGTDSSAIVGYSVINGNLATHKDDMERDQNVIVRNGSTSDGTTIFRVTNSIQGAGAIAQGTFKNLVNEPLFLTRQGVYAITAQDITGEKYAQNRSFYINGKLLEEPNLEDAIACTFNDMYWLVVNGHAYILDGLQSVMTDKSMPYATRQYCAFYRTNVPATTMWVKDNELYFGTDDGKVCRFFTDKESLLSYADDGEPIDAYWETPDLVGKLFYKNKTLRYLAIGIDSAIATSIKIWSMTHGLWNLEKEDHAFAGYFSYANLTYSKLTYSTDKTQRLTSMKLRIKKVDKFRLKFENDSVNEPFGLTNVAIEFRENGNYKN